MDRVKGLTSCRMAMLMALLVIALGWASKGLCKKPFTIVVMGSSTENLVEGLSLFEQQYGPGRVKLIVGDGRSPIPDLQDADVVLTYYISRNDLLLHRDQLRLMMEKGGHLLGHPADSVERHLDIPVDRSLLQRSLPYWEKGGAENMKRQIAFLLHEIGGDASVLVEPPVELITQGIYHPDAPKRMLFQDVGSYLAWAQANGHWHSGAPTFGIACYSMYYRSGDLRHIDALIRGIEARGGNSIAIFGYPFAAIANHFFQDGKPIINLLYSFHLNFPTDDDIEVLKKLDVPVLNLLTTKEGLEEWGSSPEGLPPLSVSTKIGGPERAGAIEPTLLATTERASEPRELVTTHLEPITDHLTRALDRGFRWVSLQRKSNSEKRLVIIYYNHPPGKSNIGASYLDVFSSLIVLLHALKEAGYNTGDRLPTKDELIRLALTYGYNVEAYAPGELSRMAQSGHAVLVPLRRYEEWFAQLPKEFRRSVTSIWGEPCNSKLMTWHGNGEAFLVIPGIRMGNIFLTPAPLRGLFSDQSRLYHDLTSPPPHQYIAAYRWYRDEFKADAIVHFGRHDTYEWTPGKSNALAPWDAPNVLTGDLPQIYPYIVDGVGEAMQALRRGSAVVISHLTPIFAPAGSYGDYRTLSDLLVRYEETELAAPQVAASYRQQILALVRKLGLDRDLNMDLDRIQMEELCERIEHYIEEMEGHFIPQGLHILGQPLTEEQVFSMVQSMVSDSLSRTLSQLFGSETEAISMRPIKYNVQKQKIEKEVNRLLRCLIMEHRDPEAIAADIVQHIVPSSESASQAQIEKLRQVLNQAALYARYLSDSPSLEIRSILNALSGRFIEAGVGGDPLRSPASIPTGRNVYGFDPNKVPTKAAWEVGKRLAEDMLARYKAEHGSYPRKVSLVIWSVETVRNHGVMEAMALALMGVRPVWDEKENCVDVALIPASELGRPRIDVVITTSGLYRDLYAAKIRLLDRAVELAANAQDADNYIRQSSEQICQNLINQGVPQDRAYRLSRARIFAPPPGEYGTGIAEPIKASGTFGSDKEVAEVYLRRMSHIYSAGLWGAQNVDLLRQVLKGNEVVIHSRSTNLYGALDNDDFFQYAGGLFMASSMINSKDPDFMVSNIRDPERAHIISFQKFLGFETRTRMLNPKWIAGMQAHGYAGAREIANHIENLWGFQVTTPKMVERRVWEEAYQAYIKDRYRLGVGKFFLRSNPYALQALAGRMVEVHRKGYHRFSPTMLKDILRIYIRIAIQKGMDCSAGTCGNQQLNRYAVDTARQLRLMDVATLHRFSKVIQAAVSPAVTKAFPINDLARAAINPTNMKALSNLKPNPQPTRRLIVMVRLLPTRQLKATALRIANSPEEMLGLLSSLILISFSLAFMLHRSYKRWQDREAFKFPFRAYPKNVRR